MFTNTQLAEMFVEGNVQRRIIIISEVLKKFIETEAPIIEKVNIQYEQFRKQPIGEIKRTEVEGFLRGDIAASKISMANYRRTFGRIDHAMAMMTSNFQLPSFLNANGIPYSAINSVQDEIRQYWDMTYGKILDRYHKIYDLLKELNRLLDEEIRTAENLTRGNYLEGFTYSEHQAELFNQERKIFWNLVEESKKIADDFKGVEDVFVARKKKTREAVIAHLRLMKNNVKTEWEQSNSGLQKSILILTYLLGAVKVYLNLKQVAIGIFTNKIKKGLASHANVKKQKEVDKLYHILSEVTRDATAENLMLLAKLV